jgi:CubicO group peptidase (beta-lactamase class C family)
MPGRSYKSGLCGVIGMSQPQVNRSPYPENMRTIPASRKVTRSPWRGARPLSALFVCAVWFAAEAVARDALSDVLLDKHRLSQSIDAVVTNRMAQGHVPGAIVTLVHGNRIVFNKGYGLADLDKRTPVDPKETLFRIASVSKVFTAAAVMRLGQQGRLDPDEDIRHRLHAGGFPLDETVPGPIPWTALLTHSAGIRERFIPSLTVTTDPSKVISLRDYLQQALPLRWQESGKTLLYSDHGIALVGQLVEMVSRKNFADAMEDLVFRPLRLKHTRYAVPKKLQHTIAVAYEYKDGRHHALDYAFSNIDPALGLLTTGGDMARFMIAHVDPRSPFLSKRSRQYMHDLQFTDDARLGYGATCGLFECRRVSPRYVFSLGYSLGFVSMLYLMPEEHVGLFISQNRAGELVFTVEDLYKMASVPRGGKVALATVDPKEMSGADSISVAGKYALTRTLSSGDGERDYVLVEALPDTNEIQLVDWRKPDSPTRWKQVEPLLFRSTNGDELISFRQGPDNRITHLFGLFPPFGVFQRVADIKAPVAK